MAARKPVIAGNWKMFGRRADLAELTRLSEAIGAAGAALDIVICPPAPYVGEAAALARATSVRIGGQDCCAVGEDAARTGDVSAAMLADAGAQYCIVGHSERRSLHGESDGLVRRKAECAQKAGLTPIVCVGETLAEREAGRVAEVIAAQIRASTPPEGEIIVAYEPVWAIGGNRTPSPDEIGEVHQLIRVTLAEPRGAGAEGVRILYGGSVGPKNAGEVFGAEGVDGALVGRASLKASDFAAIIRAHPRAV